jgi:hypothetical protein
VQAVSLRFNALTGNALQFGRCALEALDVSDNQLSGPLPSPDSSSSHGSRPWANLQVLDVSNNDLTGEAFVHTSCAWRDTQGLVECGCLPFAHS